MKIPTFSARPLALAVVAALAVSSPAVSKSIDSAISPPAAVADAFTATVLFGGPSLSDVRPSSVSRLPVIRPSDVGGLAAPASGHVLAIVHASSLPLDDSQAVTLARLFKQGTPFLVRMDSRMPDDMARVATHFGTAPNRGDMIVRNEEGVLNVFASASETAADTPALLDAFAASVGAPRSTSHETTLGASLPGSDMPDSAAGLPTRTLDFTLVDSNGEVSGVTTVEVVHSRTAASDVKLARIISKATIAPAGAGVRVNTKPHLEATSLLPNEYTLRHDVSVSKGELIYLDHFPVTNNATEFTQKWQSTLTTSFKDYSLQAGLERPGAVAWKAVIAPQFNGLLRTYAYPLGNFDSREKKMTPMMKVAAFEAASYWQMPGAYEGSLSVTVSAGYALEREYWFYRYLNGKPTGERPKHEVNAVTGLVRNTFEIPMNDPHLTADALR